MGGASDTTFVHAGRGDMGSDAHCPPIDLSTTYPIPDLATATASMKSLGSGGHPKGSSIYQRMHNPNVARFEQALASLEATDEAVAFASGMAALTAAVLAARTKDKKHIVGVRPLYAATDSLILCGMLDVEVSWATPDTVAQHIRDDTCLVLCESPANPTCTIIDIAAVCKQAGGVPVLVDSTFGTPVCQQPAKLGAAMVVHSCTKAIGGHGDILGGVVACDGEWGKKLRRVRALTGANLHPMAAYQLHRGLQTLPVRMRAAEHSAIEIAKRLASSPHVERVSFPGASGGPTDKLVGAGKQMSGPGAMIAFDLAGGYEAARALMSAVRLVTPAVSLGTTDTLIQHPAGMTHTSLPQDAKDAGGIGPGLIRLSVGLEDVEDIWDDLAQALEVGAGS